MPAAHLDRNFTHLQWQSTTQIRSREFADGMKVKLEDILLGSGAWEFVRDAILVIQIDTQNKWKHLYWMVPHLDKPRCTFRFLS